jgi:hypothetical protein
MDIFKIDNKRAIKCHKWLVDNLPSAEFLKMDIEDDTPRELAIDIVSNIIVSCGGDYDGSLFEYLKNNTKFL